MASAHDINREKLDQLERLGWYHSIELPGGQVIPGYQSIAQLRARVAQFPIPEDLRGKRVLDIGAWDGWFSFEMERRGAQVVAIDSTPHERFQIARELLNSRVEYHVDDICRPSVKEFGHFDIVLFLGVLYHVKHPMLALEKVCELSTDLVAVESFVIDDGSDLSAEPVMKFYEGTELCGQFDNWVGPNVPCLLAMCRTAGFASAKLESVLDHRAHVTCKRRWPEPDSNASEAAPFVSAVENAAAHAREFSSTNDDYVAMWFKSSRANLTAADVFPRVGVYGSHPAIMRSTGGDGWQVNFKLPPGLAPGWHEAVLRIADSGWSNAVRIGVDLADASPLEKSRLREERDREDGNKWSDNAHVSHPMPIVRSEPGAIRIAIVTDGQTWERNIAHRGLHASMSLWVAGLPAEAAKENVGVLVGDAQLAAVFLSEEDREGLRQINLMLPASMEAGEYPVAVNYAGLTSETVPVKLI